MTKMYIDYAVVKQALEFVTSEAWGTTPYMDVRVYEDAARLRDVLQAALRAAPEQQAEPVAKVELMMTGGNAGLSTRIVEIDDHLRERLRPGQLLYTAPPQRDALLQALKALVQNEGLEPYSYLDKGIGTATAAGQRWLNARAVVKAVEEGK